MVFVDFNLFCFFFWQLKDVMGSLLELWNLMDTPQEERMKFARVSSVVRSPESDVTEPNILSTETIEQVTIFFLPTFKWPLVSQPVKCLLGICRSRPFQQAEI